MRRTFDRNELRRSGDLKTTIPYRRVVAAPFRSKLCVSRKRSAFQQPTHSHANANDFFPTSPANCRASRPRRRRKAKPPRRTSRSLSCRVPCSTNCRARTPRPRRARRFRVRPHRHGLRAVRCRASHRRRLHGHAEGRFGRLRCRSARLIAVRHGGCAMQVLLFPRRLRRGEGGLRGKSPLQGNCRVRLHQRNLHAPSPQNCRATRSPPHDPRNAICRARTRPKRCWVMQPWRFSIPA